MSATNLPIPIDRALRDFARGARLAALMRAVGLGLAILGTWLMAWCLIDRLAPLPGAVRLLALIAGAGLAAFPLVQPLHRLLLASTDWVAVAGQVERTHGGLDERLVTLVSQLQSPSARRGSAAFLNELSDAVLPANALGRVGPRRWRSACAAWIGLGMTVVVGAMLWPVESLDMGSLLARLVRPLADVPRVTTTRLNVQPGSIAVAQGQSVTIKAQVQRLGDSAVELQTSQDGREWIEQPMLPQGDGSYVLALPAIQRDLFYRVTAGDAVTEDYRIALLRRPEVEEFRATYDYPPYLGMARHTAATYQPSFEAPAGTSLLLDVVSTEPLGAAALTAGSARLFLRAGPDPRTWRIAIGVDRDQSFELELITPAGLTARVAPVVVRAVPDRPPTVRLLRPAGDLRLHSRDVLPVEYQAADDHGIGALWLMTQVNGKSIRETPIRLRGDARRQAGSLALDLAALNVTVGDVVGVWIEAQDRRPDKPDRRSASDLCYVIVSPDAGLLDATRRADELREAAAWALSVVSRVIDARDAFIQRQQADLAEPQRLALSLRLNQSLASAADEGTALQQAILRAIGRSAPPDQAGALASLLDRARVLAADLADTARAALGDTAPARPAADALSRHAAEGQPLANALRALALGQRAELMMADLRSLRILSSRTGDVRIGDSVRSLQRALDQAAGELEMRWQSADVERSLKERTDAAAAVVRQTGPVDFPEVARRWAEALRRRSPGPELADRLALASVAEGLRADVDAVAERDLRLAARAAAAIETAAASALATRSATRPTSLDDAARFGPALAALQREHRLHRPPNALPPDAAAIRSAAAAARATMRAWARLADEGAATVEDLVLEANVATARQQYERAAALDAKLAEQAGSPATRRGIDPADAAASHDAGALMAWLARADELARLQQELVQRAATRPSEAMAQQRSLSSAIARILEESHAAAREGVRASPASALTAIETTLRAARHFEQMGRRLATTFPASAPAEASDWLKHLWALVGSDAHEAALAIRERLKPALDELGAARQARDRAAIDRAAARVRQALDEVQSALRAAHARLTHRDPLSTALVESQFAAALLEHRPPDPDAAQHQRTAAQALARACESLSRQAMASRHSMLPWWAAQRADGLRPPGAGADLPVVLPRTPRRWGWLSPGAPAARSAPVGETDPPAYQEPLRAYFEALHKAQIEGVTRP